MKKTSPLISSLEGGEEISHGDEQFSSLGLVPLNLNSEDFLFSAHTTSFSNSKQQKGRR